MKYVSAVAATAVVVMFSIFTQGVYAQSVEACAQIENARERLACFDQLYPREEGGAALPKISSEPIRPPSQLGQDRPARQQVDGQQPEPIIIYRDRPQESGRSGGFFDQTEQLDMDSEIAAIRRGDGQRMIFRLANDQIWMQNSPRDLPFQVGDKINIKNGRIGGYILRTDGGPSTRVRRIE